MTRSSESVSSKMIDDYTVVKVEDETELETILKANPEKIEDKLQFLTQQQVTKGARRADLLCLDQNHQLVVLELKKGSDPQQLVQALDYYDWVRQKISLFVASYPKEKIAYSTPRLMLIAEHYDDKVITAAKYIIEEVDIALKSYRIIQIGKKKLPILEDVEIPDPPEVDTPPATENDVYEASENEDMRKLAKDIVVYIREVFGNDVEVRAKNRWCLTFWTNKGKKFGEMQALVKGSYLWLTGTADDEWSKVTNLKEAKIFIDDKLKNSYRIKQGKSLPEES